MTSVSEAAAAANEAKARKDIEERRERARPTMDFLHHIAATQAMQTGFTVTLIDGTSYSVDGGDCVFTDGLSIAQDGIRTYFPKTAILKIEIHNPLPKKAG